MKLDVAIVGSGFAGTILARVLRRAGLDVVLLERDHHPRFALGESSTPLAALSLERLAARFDLPDLHHLAAYGRWLTHLPDLRRGKKRGFTFFRHRPGQRFEDREEDPARLLVAASPNDTLADCHWLRADVDHHLVEQARAEGVVYFDRTDIREVAIQPAGTVLRGFREGKAVNIEARQVVDGTGRTGLIARAVGVAERQANGPAANDPAPITTSLIYAHVKSLPAFADVARAADIDLPPGPYPDDQAAVHHLLDEGWMYQLPFDHSTASIGLLLAHRPGQQEPVVDPRNPRATFAKVVARYPTLAEQLAPAQAITPWRLVPRVQHRRARAAGPGWFLLPHTFAFADPMFSTGMAWSLLAVERLADVLTDRWGDTERYAGILHHEADAIERLVAAAYRTRHDFRRFVAVSFLYFAAVSFEEVHQRLLPAAQDQPADAQSTGAQSTGAQPPDAWRGFLGTHQADRRQIFTEALTMLLALDTSAASTARFEQWVHERIAPFNIAGLGNPARANRYPLDLDELVTRAPLLGLTRDQVLAALPRLRGETA